MRDVDVEKAAIDFKARRQRNAIVRSVVEVCRFDRRMTGEQSLALGA